MRILQVHNNYLYAGGEDVVVESEKHMLSARGHEVQLFGKNNKEIEEYSAFQKLSLLWNTAGSDASYRETLKALQTFHPDICHVHNFFPLISPSVFRACDQMHIPVVQTLHNYRLLCVNAYLFRDGHVCEECVGKSTYHSLQYGCYHDSRIQSLAVAHMIESNRSNGTWNGKVDAYICLSEFSRAKFIEGGLPPEKLFLKSNFVPTDPGFSVSSNGLPLFVGRLDEMKGIRVLLQASKLLPNVKFNVAGSGPFKEEVVSASTIEYLGQLTRNEVLQQMKNASMVVYPSVLYETFGLTLIEAFACGKPVIAGRIGAVGDIVADMKTGLLFEPGNSEDLASKLSWAISHPSEMGAMGRAARKTFEEHYTADANYTTLMEIYAAANEHRKRRK